MKQNTATVSTLNFDNVAPVLTLNVDSLTNDTTPTISGTTDMGEGTVTLPSLIVLVARKAQRQC